MGRHKRPMGIVPGGHAIGAGGCGVVVDVAVDVGVVGFGGDSVEGMVGGMGGMGQLILVPLPQPELQQFVC